MRTKRDIVRTSAILAVLCPGLLFAAAKLQSPSPNCKKCYVTLPVTDPIPSPTPSPTPTAVPTLTPAGVTAGLGMNLTTSAWYSGERPFMNLLVGSQWQDPANSWAAVPESQLDRLGYPVAIGSQGLNKMITPTPAVWNGQTVTIRCTWSGSGSVSAGGYASFTPGDHSFELTRSSPRGSLSNVWLSLKASSLTDPIRDLDCREKGEPRDAVLAPEFLDSLRGFKVIRFLDWSGANRNPAAVTWETRALPLGINQAGDQGVAPEHMLAVVNAVGASPWFTIPWNADENYIRQFAQLVHDSVPAGRQVYFEMSNEVWNSTFSVALQAQREGLERGLSTNAFEAQVRRYADKSVWMHDILSQIFADRPGQLVRVVSTQDANPWVGQTVLGWNNTARHVDALATAPYFGHSFFSGFDSSDLDAMMARLAQMAIDAIPIAKKNADTARGYGLRYLTYEAGQHVLDPAGVDRLAAINRDPRMYDIYRRYISDFHSQIGTDLLTLFSATGQISKYGAWGSREYAGQPLAETPKRRAILDSM